MNTCLCSLCTLCLDPFCQCTDTYCLCHEKEIPMSTVSSVFPRQTTLLVPRVSTTRYDNRAWSYLWEEETKVSIVTITTNVRILDGDKKYWTVFNRGTSSVDGKVTLDFGESSVYTTNELISEEEMLAKVASGEWTQRVWTTFDRIGAYVKGGKVRLYGKKKGRFFTPKMTPICLGQDEHYGALDQAVSALAERCGLEDPSITLAQRMTRQTYPYLASLVRDGVPTPLELVETLDFKKMSPSGSLKAVWEDVGILGRAMQAYATASLKKPSRQAHLSAVRMACTAGLEAKDLPSDDMLNDARASYRAWEDWSWMREMTLDARRKVLAWPDNDLSRLAEQIISAGYAVPRTCIDAKYLHDQMTAVVNAMGDTHHPMPVFAGWERLDGQDVGGYTVRLPRCSHDLKDWGSELSHCISSYYGSMARGDCLLLSLSKDGKLAYCAEVQNGKIEQVRGSHNADAPKQLTDALAAKLVALHIGRGGNTSEGFCAGMDTTRKLNVEALYAEAEMMRTLRLRFQTMSDELRVQGVHTTQIMQSVAQHGVYEAALSRFASDDLSAIAGRIKTLLTALCPLWEVDTEVLAGGKIGLIVIGDQDAIRAAGERVGVWIPAPRLMNYVPLADLGEAVDRNDPFAE